MSKRLKDSISLSSRIVTGVATVFTILGLSMKDIPFWMDLVRPVWLTIFIQAFGLLILFGLVTGVIYLIKWLMYKKQIKLKIGKNNITIMPGDIFKQEAWRVIAVDTHFSTMVDDVIISKSSLHGQLVLEHGDENGIYTFLLGTAIPYEGKDGHYIMVALTNLDTKYEAHTRMSEYESTLLKIWQELDTVYAKHDLAIPILGSGITRFDDGRDEPAELLRCMLCTLNTSKVHFKSNVSIIVYDEKMEKTLPLYEYKNMEQFLK